MGHVIRTTAGAFRANWRDEAGRQKAKTFRTRKEAAGYLAQVETALQRGQYVDPHAGRQLFGPYAVSWLSARMTARTTAARDASVMKTHILPRWDAVPIGRIDHLAVQRWVTELATTRAPATVSVCLRILSSILDSACRDRIIGSNPCEGVTRPKNRMKDTDGRIVKPPVTCKQLLPVLPDRYRALVAVAAGTGLRWGECNGLRWSAIDIGAREVHVVRVAVEVAGTVTTKPFPKSRAGRRTVPLPQFVIAELVRHREEYPAGSADEVFTNSTGGVVRRTLFRSRVWRPALVRAGLLGSVTEIEAGTFTGTWPDTIGRTVAEDFASERAAVAQVAKNAAGGLRFHDLRHSYATWLVSLGVPINDVQRVMGHERPSTTLDMYTHASGSGDENIRSAFADYLLTSPEESAPGEAAATEPEDDDTPTE